MTTDASRGTVAFKLREPGFLRAYEARVAGSAACSLLLGDRVLGQCQRTYVAAGTHAHSYTSHSTSKSMPPRLTACHQSRECLQAGLHAVYVCPLQHSELLQQALEC
jgi:hypothetical protein